MQTDWHTLAVQCRQHNFLYLVWPELFSIVAKEAWHQIIIAHEHSTTHSFDKDLCTTEFLVISTWHIWRERERERERICRNVSILYLTMCFFSLGHAVKRSFPHECSKALLHSTSILVLVAYQYVSLPNQWSLSLFSKTPQGYSSCIAGVFSPHPPKNEIALQQWNHMNQPWPYNSRKPLVKS